jgi:hypothetical protein
MKKLGWEGACPESEQLFDLVEDSSRLTKEEKENLESHLVSCELCADEVRELVERLKIEVGEPSGQMIDLPSGIADRLRDLTERYPHPQARIFSRDSTQSWWKKHGRNWSRFFDLSSIKLPELSAVAVRSGLTESPNGEDVVSLVEKARQIMENGDYGKAGQIYKRISRSVTGLPLERETRFRAGISFFLEGSVNKAAEELMRAINEEAEAEIFWVLAHTLFKMGELEGGYRCLQIIESFGDKLGEEAGRLLDEIDSL